MVIPNFFITFVRHSFPTSTPCTPPSRERRHRPAPPCHQAPHSPHAHALPHALSARDCLTHCTSQGYATRATHTLCILALTAHTPSVLPPLAKGYATRATHTLRILVLTAHSPSALPPLTRAMPHAPHTRYASSPSQHTRPPRYPPSQGLCHAALPPSMKATLLHAPTPPQVF